MTGQLFFPAEDRVAELLSGFAVFAVGYSTRPLGGTTSLIPTYLVNATGSPLASAVYDPGPQPQENVEPLC